MSSVKHNIGGDEQMLLRHRPFQWSCRGAQKQITWHCPMQHVQGYIGSHWTLPSGDYSLRIAPTAAMATINKTTM